MKISLLSAILLSLSGVGIAQPQDACNKGLTFCWLGPYSDNSDEAQAWGNRWVSQDKAEKPLEQVVEVRCLKAFEICIVAHNQLFFSYKRLTSIDIYRVSVWNENQINAKEEHGVLAKCEEDSLIINRAEQSTLLVASPGPDADKKVCTDIMGNAKTVIYQLTQ